MGRREESLKGKGEHNDAGTGKKKEKKGFREIMWALRKPWIRRLMHFRMLRRNNKRDC